MPVSELDADKNLARHYVLGNEYIGLDHNYYLTDEQGSVRYVLDADGNVQNDYQYDAFGQRIAGHENIPNRLRYNARIEDDLTGLYYPRARYYNTGIGRFTQEDVIYNDGLNLYACCGSNLVMYADPSGYSCEPKDGAENSKSGTKVQGVGNPVKVEGKGNTGRTIPNTLNEQMAMHQVVSNPLDNAIDMSQLNKHPIIMTDPRWSASDGWVKMSNNVNGIEIHFVYNKITGAFDDFKFK